MMRLALLALLALPAGADELGMNTHIPSDAELDAVAELGVGWIRIDNNWLTVEAQQGRYEWRELDRVVDGARQRGLQVYMTLAYAPRWATEPDTDGVHSNDVPRPGTYEGYVRAAVEHFEGRVTHYGIWNEPNLDHFWEGSVEQYLERVLRPGAAAVKAACPECLVLGPDLAGVGNWQSYMEAVLEGAGEVFDILTHHTYASPQSLRAQWICDDFDHALDIGDDAICFYKPGLRQVMDAAGIDAPMWLSETGYRADPWDDANQQARQATYVEYVMDRQLETPWWTNTFFYELTDCRPALPDCDIDGYGIMRRQGEGYVRKPAYAFIQGELADNPMWADDFEPPPPPMEEPPHIDAPRRMAGMPDARLDDWDDEGCVLLEDYELVESVRIGAADLSARACAAWTAEALWLSVEVRDEVHQNEQPRETLWAGDSVQLAIDVDADGAEGAGYDEDDREFSLALSGGESRIHAHQGPLGATTGAVSREGDRTRYELRVPLNGLVAERELKVSFLVNDADGAGREGWLEWTPGIGREKAPASFGSVRLEDRAAVPSPDAGVSVDMGRPPPPIPMEPDTGAEDPDGGPEPDADLRDGGVGPGPDGAAPTPRQDAGGGLGRPTNDASFEADSGGDEGCSQAPGRGASWPLLLLLLLTPLRRRP